MVDQKHSVDGKQYASHYLTPATAETRKGWTAENECSQVNRVNCARRLSLSVGKHLSAVLLCIAAMACPGTFARVAQAQGGDSQVDAAAVQRAINRGVVYLRKSQSERGGWEEFSNQSCGVSSLCTLSLLNAGVSRDDPGVSKALRYLRGIEPKETYAVALQTLVFCQVGAAGDLPRIRRNVELLTKMQKKTEGRIGGWGYGGNRSGGDPSNTQFALLALGAAQDRGIEVPPVVFERTLKYWESRQAKFGGWGYGRTAPTSGSMTCAGIASVIIARGRLSQGSSSIAGDQIQCCGGDDDGQDSVTRAIDWLSKHFTVDINPGGHSGTYYYYLYALERVGRLSGRRLIGDHDWYREGATVLLRQQDGFQGFWAGVGWEEDRNIATSLALLFLSKGKRQVVVGQLRHGDDASGGWQKHPDAMRQLVRHIERDWGRDLTWQTIDGERAKVEDLLQTPVLIISDNRPLQFSLGLRERLKEYVDQGGTILFEADGGSGCGDATGFQSSVQAMCAEWFDGVELKRLPPSHPVWFAERKVDVNSLPGDFWVYGIQACCRTSVFYVPHSLSCRWELSDTLFRRGEGSAVVRKKIDTSVRIGQNVIAYATGRELKDKLEERSLLSGDELALSSRGAIRVAMLELGAGGEEARRALPNAATIIHKRGLGNFVAAPDTVGFDQESLKDVFVLWIHGRTEFQFTEPQRETLREYIENGGVVFGSAICGSEAFAKSFRDELKRMLPDAPLAEMPPNHPAFTTVFDGDDVRRITIRKPSQGGSRQNGSGQTISRRASHPLVEVAMVNGAASVFFSPLDLSCALESRNSVQCPGYGTDDAAKIVGNLVLYSMQ